MGSIRALHQLLLSPLRFLVGCTCSQPCALTLPPTRRAAEPAAPSSRFVFEGPLPPVVMVAPVGGNGAGGPGTIPWRCPIDRFSGEEEVPQVRPSGLLLSSF